MRSEKYIFISHRECDKAIADMLLGFLTSTGIPRELIKCSSLPGNDVREKIASEVRSWIEDSVVNIVILSHDYYKSAYCLNEAGVIWYLKDVPVIPIALPGIDPPDMVGFLNCDYKIRRLNSDTDIAEIYDKIQESIEVDAAKHSIITAEIVKLKERYKQFCDDREVLACDNDSEESDDLDDDDSVYTSWLDDDIYEDGYHERHDNEGNIVEKGEYKKGTLVNGIKYNVIVKISVERANAEELEKQEPTGEEEQEFDTALDYDVCKEKLLEEPIQIDQIKEKGWNYSEVEIYDDSFIIFHTRDYIKKLGLEYFYVVDKKVRLEGKVIKPTFTNFRTLETFLSEKNPDVLEYIKTGVWGFKEADSVDIEDG